jgi:hypothetical protein
MARGGWLPRAAGRAPRFLRTGSSARYQPERDTSSGRAEGRQTHTLGHEAEAVLQSLLFHRASQGLRAQRATFRILAERDPDVDAALASAMGCSPLPRSLTPPRPPLSDQRGRAALRCGAAQIVRTGSRGRVAAFRAEQRPHGSVQRGRCRRSRHRHDPDVAIDDRAIPPRLSMKVITTRDA